MSKNKRKLLVLARRDPLEAMRVAAGLTIFGHDIRLVFMGKSLAEETMESEHAELLELSDIVPETTVVDMAEFMDVLDENDLATALRTSDGVINI
ncbi:MAG TPA: hypothetical protein ENI62_09580 [Gammaproteobacteria bacterium]|nr:hypothetical protein [Gammaproteobacteria bacterium]